jgi:hypothetical protein
MTTIELKADEAAILREILQHDHDGLLLELSRADSLAFKEVLRPREALLTKVLQQLGAQSVPD